MPRRVPPIVVMGVQGSGKSTIGARLADRLGVPFLDGDDLHSDENRRRMAAGVPLTDDLRRPWLDEIGRRLAEASDGIVIACSALRRDYRDRLRVAAPETFTVHPAGPIELVAERIGARTHEFMPPELLQSQYATLEALGDDEHGLVVDLRLDPDAIVETVVSALERLERED
ncbi:gluconokinase [Agromyces larvae]|uniref:Gluconokinase n=1 Tax=Agromyces larvae TaxID=2929802 RepID=A0ABY4C429_9MICO|nr:gluconokinase, GntK/IdnK-type [Agromyces larvae]UOE45734.1 gluconokinase, GntK/IdnK-type [Agromyces larvae]